MLRNTCIYKLFHFFPVLCTCVLRNCVYTCMLVAVFVCVYLCMCWYICESLKVCVYGMGHKKVPVSFFYKDSIYSHNGTGTVETRHGPVRSTSVQQLIIKRSVQRLIKRSVHFQRCLRVLPTNS